MMFEASVFIEHLQLRLGRIWIQRSMDLEHDIFFGDVCLSLSIITTPPAVNVKAFLLLYSDNNVSSSNFYSLGLPSLSLQRDYPRIQERKTLLSHLSCRTYFYLDPTSFNHHHHHYYRHPQNASLKSPTSSSKCVHRVILSSCTGLRIFPRIITVVRCSVDKRQNLRRDIDQRCQRWDNCL
ncbi:hypothetical protein K435DRAFT_139787 [Dendrothele bispora CBS 962.96]|uniref:Uncharacterized protein n=1 Tax=Dendrothele bispora (strain CBS 962.96) TaxID=1314807 RepID=A0A4S8LZQ3_DENBC|nr:hypothetical protein K435DRAFT_139787 [Dendrothele bispora CBS 962.96]